MKRLCRYNERVMESDRCKRFLEERSSRAKYIWPKRNGQDRDPNSELAILRGFPLRLLPRRSHLAHRSPFSANSTTFFRICHSQVRVSRRVPFLDRGRRSGCTLVRIRSKGNLPFLNLNQRQLHEFTRDLASNPRGVYLTMNEDSCQPVDTNIYSDRAFFKYHNDLSSQSLPFFKISWRRLERCTLHFFM